MNTMRNVVNKSNVLTGVNGMAAGSKAAAEQNIPVYWAYYPGKNNYIPVT